MSVHLFQRHIRSLFTDQGSKSALLVQFEKETNLGVELFDRICRRESWERRFWNDFLTVATKSLGGSTGRNTEKEHRREFSKYLRRLGKGLEAAEELLNKRGPSDRNSYFAWEVGVAISNADAWERVAGEDLSELEASLEKLNELFTVLSSHELSSAKSTSDTRRIIDFMIPFYLKYWPNCTCAIGDLGSNGFTSAFPRFCKLVVQRFELEKRSDEALFSDIRRALGETNYKEKIAAHNKVAHHFDALASVDEQDNDWLLNRVFGGLPKP